MLDEKVRYGIPVYIGLGRGGWSMIKNNEKKYNRLELLAIAEQTPNRNNRVTVVEEKDALGCSKTKLHFTYSDEDIASIRRAQTLMGEALTESGLGTYMPPKDDAAEIKNMYGLHHTMGTTRMSDDPLNGVVDSDCRVHGFKNIFIAGNSTFSTGGYANPTLTGLAVSLRVADKVKTMFNP
jgi:choline dehydrogenase-like flavoprotein